MGKPTGNSNTPTHRYSTRSKDMHKIFSQAGKHTATGGGGGRKLLFSATNTKNWFYKDTILDFFKKTRHNRIVKQQITKVQPLPENFKSTIIQNGITFETETIKHLKKKLGAKNFRTICIDYRLATSNGMYQETMNAMKEGVPIIYQGVLHNYSNGTYGIPDLLVRSDWLNRVVKNDSLSVSEIKLVAPILGKPWHYRVVDVKCSTLPFAANGTNLLNSGSIPAYKGQLCIYNDALAEMQGYDSGKSYILGKRWSHDKRVDGKRINTVCNDCFDRYGEINYHGYDKKYKKDTEDALEWLHDLEDNGEKWQLYPPTNSNLYPNMKNTYDYPYHSEKKELAEQIGEITQIWYCGVKNRKLAHAKGITSWRDPRCNSEVLGLTGRIGETVDKILEVNRESEELIYIDPSFVQTGLHKKKFNIEFYVDFETISNVVDEPSIPINTDYNIIYMIGVGYEDPDTKEWVYRDFTVESCSSQEERRIMQEWIEYMYEVAGEPLGMYPLQAPVYHWSHIEMTMFNEKIKEHPELQGYKIGNWVDLCKTFTNCPIIPKGALGFGLKEVARAMYQNKLIESLWNAENPCSNGLESMVIFKHIRDKAETEGKDIRQVPLMKDIIDYNELDCKVMWEILAFLRRDTQVILEEVGESNQMLIGDDEDDLESDPDFTP
jgi:hypothetical protein